MILNDDTKNELREYAKKYVPETLLVSSMWPERFYPFRVNLVTLEEAAAKCANVFETYRETVIRYSHSNNWLKMHGYPLRRGENNKRAWE